MERGHEKYDKNRAWKIRMRWTLVHRHTGHSVTRKFRITQARRDTRNRESWYEGNLRLRVLCRIVQIFYASVRITRSGRLSSRSTIRWLKVSSSGLGDGSADFHALAWWNPKRAALLDEAVFGTNLAVKVARGHLSQACWYHTVGSAQRCHGFSCSRCVRKNHIHTAYQIGMSKKINWKPHYRANEVDEDGLFWVLPVQLRSSPHSVTVLFTPKP